MVIIRVSYNEPLSYREEAIGSSLFVPTSVHTATPLMLTTRLAGSSIRAALDIG